MLSIYDFQVEIQCVSYTTVRWKVQDTFEDTSNYVYEISKSESSEGPYEAVFAGTDVFEFIDDDINVYSMQRECY